MTHGYVLLCTRKISSLSEVDISELISSYPLAKLNKLEELISNPRWVIPVLPKAELEVLLEASIELAKYGADNEVGIKRDKETEFYTNFFLLSSASLASVSTARAF